jgi:hypothetical protein
MGMSFPRDTIILTDGMPREHQGIAASLFNNVVHYSVSIILGIADTTIQQTQCARELLKRVAFCNWPRWLWDGDRAVFLVDVCGERENN